MAPDHEQELTKCLREATASQQAIPRSLKWCMCPAAQAATDPNSGFASTTAQVCQQGCLSPSQPVLLAPDITPLPVIARCQALDSYKGCWVVLWQTSGLRWLA